MLADAMLPKVANPQVAGDLPLLAPKKLKEQTDFFKGRAYEEERRRSYQEQHPSNQDQEGLYLVNVNAKTTSSKGITKNNEINLGGRLYRGSYRRQ